MRGRDSRRGGRAAGRCGGPGRVRLRGGVRLRAGGGAAWGAWFMITGRIGPYLSRTARDHGRRYGMSRRALRARAAAATRTKAVTHTPRETPVRRASWSASERPEPDPEPEREPRRRR